MVMLRVAIVEDEELQRQQLVKWLVDEPDTELVAEATDGESAVRLIDETRPDVVLLDVALPEFSGFEVLDRIHHTPDIVFTTAYREHAISAFELGAVDYLLKPFARERLSAALQRVRARERMPDESSTAALAERVTAVRDEGRPLERLFVRDRGAIVPVSVGEIVRLEADGDYTAVVTATRRMLVAVPLGTLHDRIQRSDFVRVHRQHVVNLAHVARLVPHDAGRFLIEFRSGGPVVASRAGSQLLRELVE
jgi:two-component system, LytTR family, response regulator